MTDDATQIIRDVTTIGKYQQGRILGKGAMGVVYEAYDPDI